jgi:hypothetical protein
MVLFIGLKFFQHLYVTQVARDLVRDISRYMGTVQQMTSDADKL